MVLKRHLRRIQPGSRRLRNHLGVNGAKTLMSSHERPCTSSAHEHDVSTSVTDSDALECGSVIRDTRGEEQEEVKIQRLSLAAHEQRAKYNACAPIAFVLQEYCAATMAIQLLFPKGSPLPTACSLRFSLSTRQDSASLHFTCSSRNVSPLGRVSWSLLHAANSQTTNSDSRSVNTTLPTTPAENERQSET